MLELCDIWFKFNLVLVLHNTSATKSKEKARNFRYGMPLDFLVKGKTTRQGGGGTGTLYTVQSPSWLILGTLCLISLFQFYTNNR